MQSNKKYEKSSPIQITVPQPKQNPSLKHKNSSSFEQQIMIKNIDSGNYQLFNVQEVDYVSQLKDPLSAQTKVSLWNSYWDQIAKYDTKLFRLVKNKDSQKLKKILLQQPIQLNSFKYIDGWTLLHHAVINSSEQIVKILIQNKININLQSEQMKRTALHQAVLANKISMVQILIQYDIDLNLQDVDGNTPIHYSAQLSYFEIFNLFISSKKQILFDIKNHQQMTVLDCIRDEKFFQVLEEVYPEIIKENENYLSKNMENRRIVRVSNDVVLKRYSKNDLIEKFLNRKSEDFVKQEKAVELVRSVTSNGSNDSKKKHNLVGKKPSNWIQKRGKIIASQSICLMKQSTLEPELNEDQNQQNLQNYQILRFLGQGGFAQVFLARKKKSTNLYALKRINKQKIIQNNLKRYVYSERNIMIKCNHPFIVQAYSMFQDDAHLYIAMQYCQCGDLQKLISQKGKLSEQQAKIYAAQIGLALQQIHSKNILFRDLKSANVLLSKDGNSKISDFGLAKQSSMSFSFLGSVQYLAPQMLVDTQMKQHTKSIDWYLYGVLIYQMLTGKTPFYGQKQHILFKKIKQQKPSYPSFISKQCRSLLQKLLQKNPERRLGSKNDFSDIQQQQWFKDINFSKILTKKYELPFIEPLIKQSDLRKKIPIDDIVTNQKYEYFKQWNYVKQR